MPLTLQPFLTESGQGFTVRAATGPGAVNDPALSAMITAVADGNETQLITLTGQPAGNAFTLGFGGNTTPPIPITASPPARYAQWNVTGITPGTYDITVNKSTVSWGTTAQLFEVFDGPVSGSSVPMATVTLNQQDLTGYFNDAGVMAQGGWPVNWFALGRFTFASTQLHIRCSSPADGNFFSLNDLRITPPSGTPIAYYQPDDDAGVVTVVAPGYDYGGAGHARGFSNYQMATDTYGAVNMQGNGAGLRALADPAAVQAALEALASVGAGNVVVSGDGSTINPMVVGFRGTLGGSSQPLITATDPAVHVARRDVGGILPVLHCTRLGTVRCSYADVYWNKTVHCMPTVDFFFDQAGGSPVVFLATDVVTVDWGDDWMAGTAGTATAVTGLAVENRVGIPLYPPLPTSVTMEVGMNLEAAANNFSNIKYSNYFRVAPVGVMPTTYAGGATLNLPGSFPSQTYGGAAKYAAQVPVGPKVFWWDGASDMDVAAFSNYGTVSGVTKTLDSGHVNNKVAFTCSGNSYSYSAAIAIAIHAASGSGPWTYDFRNPRFLAAGVDPDTFPKFAPGIVARFAGMNSTRFLEGAGCINGNPITFDDFMGDPAVMGLSGGVRTIGPSTITRVEQATTYTGFDFNKPLLLAIGTPMLFTIPGHGFAQDTLAYVSGDIGPITIRNTAGTTKTITVPAGYTSTIHIIDADHVAFTRVTFPWQQGDPADDAHRDYKMIGVITSPGVTLRCDIQCDPLDDMIDFCNATGTSAHFPVSFSANDDAITRVTQRWAARLNSGLKFRPEMSNEVWNSGVNGPYGIASQGSVVIMGGTDPGFWAPYYVARFKHVMDIMRAAWAGAGRDPADFQSILGSQGGGPGHTADFAALAHSIGARIDVLCIGDYVENQPLVGPQYEPDFYPVIGRMTTQQHLDKLDEHMVLGGWEHFIDAHRAALDGYPEYITTDIIVYEGGTDNLYLPGLEYVDDAGYRAKAHAIGRDPRWFGQHVHRLRVLQDGGLRRYHKYQHCHLDFPGTQGWNCYDHTAQLPYSPGDPVQDALQRVDPADPNAIHSISGGVFLHWASLFNATPPTPDFTISVTGPTTLVQGGAATRTVTIARLAGYAGTVALTDPGLPPGVGSSFSPSSLAGPATSSTETLTATGSAQVGTTTATVVGLDAANSLTHTAGSGLTVVAGTPPTGPSVRPRRYVPGR
jgi:hypothetical protein